MQMQMEMGELTRIAQTQIRKVPTALAGKLIKISQAYRFSAQIRQKFGRSLALTFLYIFCLM